jgi:hypothetical protein
MARAKRRNHHSGGENGNAGDELEFEKDKMRKESEEAMSAARRQARMTRKGALAAFDAFGFFSGPMARVMDQNRLMLQKLMRLVQEESLRFVNRRFEHTTNAIESCRDCKRVSSLMAVQQEWMLDFARDYAEHTKRFTELMREQVEDGAATLSEVSSAVMEHRRGAGGREHWKAA